MRLCYIANHHNFGVDDTEGHITYGFRQRGWVVMEIMEENYREAQNMEVDLLLFHHWDIPERLEFIKTHPAKKKAFWYFDKIYGQKRPQLIQENLKVIDYAFIGDGSYAQNNPHSKFHILRQGIGDRLVAQGLGIAKPGVYKAKIAFVGGVYSAEREKWATDLKMRYGEDFQVYQGVYNRDLFDLCTTVPIIIGPNYPVDNHYWGNRAYLITGSGGFLIHYACQDLQEEFSELVFYENMEDLYQEIDYYLSNEQRRKEKQIEQFGKAKQLSMAFRVKQLLGML